MLIARPLMAVLILAAVLAPSAPAAAAEDRAATANTLFLRAADKHKAGDIDGAIALLEKAVRQYDDAILHYNLGVLYDRNGDQAQAIAHYGTYVKTMPVDRALILERVRQLSPDDAEFIEEADPEPIDPYDFDEEEPMLIGDVGAPVEGPATPGVSAPGGGAGGLTWTMLGLGVAGLGAGGGFGFLALGNVEDFNVATLRGEASDHRDKAKQNAMIANVAFGVGAVALTAGLIGLLVAGGDDAEEVSEGGGAGVVPVVGGGTFGVAVTAPF